jgi:hypothetical protein
MLTSDVIQPAHAADGTRVWSVSGHISAADKAVSDYQLVPFEVPPGLARLTVSYEYTHAVSAALPEGSGNVIDIGCFDPRGAEFLGGAGFRGWSGSNRRTFTVAHHDATPGYLPGPIQPGAWHIILGLYHIQPAGCDYRIEIRGSGDARAPVETRPLPSSVSLSRSLSPSPAWYRGDLHAHTQHSDATGSLADLAATARMQGLDFVAVTDHNTVSHLPHLTAAGGDDLLLIPGQEITTYYGHANAWGIRGWQEFRGRDTATMARIIAAAHAAGALVSANHPKDGGPAWEYSPDLPFDCVEVWQKPWPECNTQSLAFWDRLLRQGRRVVAVGGSDRHVPPFTGSPEAYDLGTPTTWVYADELSVTGILAGIRAGHVFISAGPPGPELCLAADADGDGRYESRMGDEVTVAAGRPLALRAQVAGGAGLVLWIVSGAGVETAPVLSDEFSYDWQVRPPAPTFYRLELAEPETGERQALSNPIWVKKDPGPGQIRKEGPK